MALDSDLQWAYSIGDRLAQYLKNNPDNGRQVISMLLERAMNAEGFRSEVQRKMGVNPVADPQANWEKLMYTPTKFKQIRDKKTGQMRDLTPDEKKKKIWNSIRMKGILGDVATGAGAIGGAIPAMMAGQLESNARNSATRRQKELYGATAADRAAAAAVPMFQGLSTLLPMLSGLVANRFYQEAGDQRNAYLTALSDATFNNIKPPASYMHERRLIGQEE